MAMENLPLESLELQALAENISPNDWRRLGLFLGISEIKLANWERQFMFDIERVVSTMLFTWHNNQDPHAERGLLATALESSKLRNLADKLKKGQFQGKGIPGMNPIPAPQAPMDQPYYPPQQADQQPLYQAPPAAHAYQPAAPTHIKTEPGVYQSATVHQPEPQRPAPRPRPEVSEILLRDLSQKLGSEWKTVGTYLGFESAEIQVLQEQYSVVKECIFQMLLQWRNTSGVNAKKLILRKAVDRSGRNDLMDFFDEHNDSL